MAKFQRFVWLAALGIAGLMCGVEGRPLGEAPGSSRRAVSPLGPPDCPTDPLNLVGEPAEPGEFSEVDLFCLAAPPVDDLDDPVDQLLRSLCTAYCYATQAFTFREPLADRTCRAMWEYRAAAAQRALSELQKMLLPLPFTGDLATDPDVPGGEASVLLAAVLEDPVVAGVYVSRLAEATHLALEVTDGLVDLGWGVSDARRTELPIFQEFARAVWGNNPDNIAGVREVTFGFLAGVDEDQRAKLAVCDIDAGVPGVARGVQMLRRHNPIWFSRLVACEFGQPCPGPPSRPAFDHDPTRIADHLRQAVNRERVNLGSEPYADVDAFLAGEEVSLADLQGGSRYIEQESGAYLYDLFFDPVLDFTGYRPVRGFAESPRPRPPFLLRQHSDDSMPAQTCGESCLPPTAVCCDPTYEFKCVLIACECQAVCAGYNGEVAPLLEVFFPEDARAGSVRTLDFARRWLLTVLAHLEDDASTFASAIPIARSAVDQIDAAIGRRRVTYTRTVDEFVTVAVEDVDCAEELIVMKDENALRCFWFGHLEQQPCDIDDFIVARSSEAGLVTECGPSAARSVAGYDDVMVRTLRLPASRISSTLIFNPDSGFLGGCDPANSQIDLTSSTLFTRLGDDVIDRWQGRNLPWPPAFSLPGAFTPVEITFTNNVGGRYAQIEEDIHRRRYNQCGEPVLNALRLPVDFVPPLETELISDADTYEDSFAFYLDFLGAAAETAGERIQESIDAESALGLASAAFESAREDALDRVEQICGTGSESCTVTATTEPLDLPTIERPIIRRGLPPCGPPPVEGGPPPSDEPCCGSNREIDPDTGVVRPPVVCYVEEPADCDVLFTEPPAVNDKSDLQELSNFILCEGVRMLGAFRGIRLPWIEVEGVAGGELQIVTLELERVREEISRASFGVEAHYRRLSALLAAEYERIDSIDDASRSWFEGIGGVFEGIGGLVSAGMSLFSGDPSFSQVASGLRSAAEGFAQAAGALSVTEPADQQDVQEEIAEFMVSFVTEMDALSLEFMWYRDALLRAHQIVLDAMGLGLEMTQRLAEADRLGEDAFTEAVGGEADLATWRRIIIKRNKLARQALRRAKVAALIARRAVEFRLGVDLNQETSTGVIVDSPREWADSLFSVSQVQTPFADDPESVGEDLTTYAQKLEDYALVAYSFEYPFADAQDTAVLSLRDRLARSEFSCLEPLDTSPNRIAFSEQFDEWKLTAGTLSLDVADVPSDFALERPFGLPTNAADELAADAASGAIVSPPEEVEAGEELVAWTASVYARSGSTASPTIQLALIVEHTPLDCVACVETTVSTSTPAVVGDDWSRFSFTIPSIPAPTVAGPVRTTLRMVIAAGPGDEVVLFGAQLEVAASPGAYVPAPLFGLNPACDVLPGEEGQVLVVPTPEGRADLFRRRFNIKCVDAPTAAPGVTPDRCDDLGGVDWFEISFPISLAMMESGELIDTAQIAPENYNYRFENLAVNLIGDDLKDCSVDPFDAKTCSTENYISYSLFHDGHVTLRNHAGQPVEFNMPEGRIHFGKAFADGRVFSNPMSVGDLASEPQFVKPELRGRPLEGVFTLRIHNVQSFVWERLEDVQLVVHYRYWSQFGLPGP